MGDFTAKTRPGPGPAAEFWRKTLTQIPTLFGRLVFLASLRNEATGRYHHDALYSLEGPDEADRTLAQSHQQVFAQWIACPLADQKADLDQYISGVGGQVQSLWQYRNAVPPKARDVERQLYLTDFETLLDLLRFDYAGAASLPGPLPRR